MHKKKKLDSLLLTKLKPFSGFYFLADAAFFILLRLHYFLSFLLFTLVLLEILESRENYFRAVNFALGDSKYLISV